MMYYHGGKPGLGVGDSLIPSAPHVYDGCPICVARLEGRRYTFGEWRAWLATQGPKGQEVIRRIAEFPDDAEVDPPSRNEKVYITSDEEYATWYAARSGHGDLYQVVPVGELIQSEEDLFPTWMVDEAVIIAVIRRRVFLTRKNRRSLDRRWMRAERGEKVRA